MIIKAAFFSNQLASLDMVYGNGRKDRLAEFCDPYPVLSPLKTGKSLRYAVTLEMLATTA